MASRGTFRAGGSVLVPGSRSARGFKRWAPTNVVVDEALWTSLDRKAPPPRGVEAPTLNRRPCCMCRRGKARRWVWMSLV